ncbi:uncharacterized protein LOC125955439 [Anopheles darlingi]|uniref:uncharacterized protein LOC125955439 n=1 Tax=Anopheles darlingi TaxID=43151 RepID=UPI0020FFF895|nr:uncharacterized protein LOC125955439 [Anopheles darlingi]
MKIKADTWHVNGKRQIDVPFSEKLEFSSDAHPTTLTIRCFFTEEYTNRTISKRQRITVYKNKYVVTKENRRLTYHQGSPFTARLKVTYNNDEPAKLVTLLVAVQGVNETYRQNCTGNRKGLITFSMPTNNSTKLNSLKVYDGDQEIDRWNIYNVPSADLLADKYIKVELLTRVKFNRMIRLLITCSDNMTILLYHVFTKGNIVEFGSFKPNQTNRYSFQLLMSDKLIPRSRIFVATIVRKSFICGDVELSINDFGNPLKINIEENISEDGVDPGDEIELGIRGRPGAFVALTAYDQRLLQHGKDHDILFADVWESLYMLHPSTTYNIRRELVTELFTIITDATTSVLGKCNR